MNDYASWLHINVSYIGKGIFGNESNIEVFECERVIDNGFIEKFDKFFSIALRTAKNATGQATISISTDQAMTTVRRRFYSVDYGNRETDTVTLYQCDETGGFSYLTGRAFSYKAAKKDFHDYLETMQRNTMDCIEQEKALVND